MLYKPANPRDGEFSFHPSAILENPGALFKPANPRGDFHSARVFLKERTGVRRRAPVRS